MLAIFTGENASLQAYGFRFEKGKQVEVKDDKVLKKLKAREDFEVLEPEKPVTRKENEGTITTTVGEGTPDAYAGEGKTTE